MTAIYKPTPKRSRTTRGDRVFYTTVNIVMGFILIAVLYPLIYVISSSISSGSAILAGKVVLWPVGFSLDGYAIVFQYRSIIDGFRNSVVYTIIGTILNVSMVMLCAYPLARKTLPMRRSIMLIFTFTMYFSGGLIPLYLVVRDLKLIRTMWSLIIPGALSVYYTIIARTFIQSSIPQELLEASKMDGCSDFRYFTAIVLPLSKAIIAVIALYCAVGHWNSWFNALIYLNDRKQYPLQLVLRDILIVNQLDTSNIQDSELAYKMMTAAELMKYSLIVIASAPMLILYPFVQKYFVKGVMIGSIKG
ncbi:sugar ABC transporter permease [Clostridia bacterium]|nr:sugar ABC transporter permease [Clostridia bacterium]